MQRLKVEIMDQFGSQRKFAQEIGLHETTVSNIVSGAFQPSEEQQAIIAKGLGVDWDKLIEQV
jgi:transcriptional regulator with XRE-family HTH domain